MPAKKKIPKATFKAGDSPTSVMNALPVVSQPPVLVDAKLARSLHTVAPRLGMTIATRADKKNPKLLKVWRLE